VDYGYHEAFGREGEKFGENMKTQWDFFPDKLNEITENSTLLGLCRDMLTLRREGRFTKNGLVAPFTPLFWDFPQSGGWADARSLIPYIVAQSKSLFACNSSSLQRARKNKLPTADVNHLCIS